MTTTKTTYTEEQQIARVAKIIAGAIFEDAEGTIESRLEQAIAWRNQGTDCDLSSTDRDRLRLLLDAATGITSDLTDSETSEVIREATVAEACASAEAGPEGHTVVDGRRCYVSL